MPDTETNNELEREAANAELLDRALPTSIGIELEMHQHDTAKAARALTKRKLNVSGQEWKGDGDRDDNYWVVKTDASAGVEVVSKILRTYRDLEEVVTAADALIKAGFTCADECGFHVHIGVEDLNAAEREHFTRFFVHFEDAFFDLAPTRRGNNYTKPLKMQILKDLRHGKGWAAWTCQPERYYWMNGKAWAAHRTMEFRLMTGSLNFKHIQGWMCTLLYIYQLASRRQFQDVNAHEKSGATGAKLFDEMMDVLRLKNATYAEHTCAGRAKDWLNNRRDDVLLDKDSKRRERRRRLKEAWAGGKPFVPVVVGHTKYGDHDDPNKTGKVSHHGIQTISAAEAREAEADDAEVAEETAD